jgi:hypothetical protein
MTLTDRMIIGSIANNPANYEAEGEWRYSIPHKQLYFSSAREPDDLDKEPWLPLPALDPDGSKRKIRAFKHFIRRRWVPSRQKELEDFARKRGWELAMELKYGGGALEDKEAEEWQYVINRELERLVKKFREQITQAEQRA